MGLITSLPYYARNTYLFLSLPETSPRKISPLFQCLLVSGNELEVKLQMLKRTSRRDNMLIVRLDTFFYSIIEQRQKHSFVFPRPKIPAPVREQVLTNMFIILK